MADVVGAPGRRAIETRLPALREELGVEFCVVNGENVADGVGITPRLAERLLAAGADVITLGNHVWRRAEIGPYLETSERLIRPANLSRLAPGRGLTVASAADGSLIVQVEGAVVNVGLGGRGLAVRGKRRQSPSTQHRTGLEQQVPVPSRMIVLKDDESRHDGQWAGGQWTVGSEQ